MSDKKVRFAVLGTGNSGQAFAADLSLRGYSVNLGEVPQFEANLKAIQNRGGIEISGESGQGFARLNMVTTDLAKAIKGVDLIILGGSAHAHEPLARALAKHFEDGQFILMVSNFGAIRFKKIMKELGATADVTPVESVSLLYATRAVEPGKVKVMGVKGTLPVAALPARRTGEFLKKISSVFPKFTAAENVFYTSLNNLNPIAHPPMVLFNAGRIESTGGKGWNLYVDGATESVVNVMLAMDQERLAILDRLGVTGILFRDSFENFYKAYSLEKRTLSEMLRQSPIHGDLALPAPAVLDTRYLHEDIPFGLVPWSSLGRMLNIPTPNMDAVIQIASTMLDRDYFTHGITVKDLGIEDLGPAEMKELVS